MPVKYLSHNLPWITSMAMAPGADLKVHKTLKGLGKVKLFYCCELCKQDRT